MRILNPEALVSHGNVRGRKALVEILEAGLRAADPYHNTMKLMRIVDGKLVVGRREFEPLGDPDTGGAVYDLDRIGRIYVFGAGKGVQHLAKAAEEVLGDRLTGGHVIGKKGDGVILDRIGVTLGAHPVPDEDCVRGCREIVRMCDGLRAEDLVITFVSNGVSALLTMPVPGVSLEDVRRTTYIMQIERGVPTGDLNPIRNHLDMMKGGRITKYIQPAQAIHVIANPPGTYDQLMHHNVWLHTLPKGSTFETAIANLERWDAWDAAPASVREHLTRADPEHETVKAAEFQRTRSRIFGVMPHETGMVPTAQKKAADLGFRPVTLAQGVRAEASQAASMMAAIARTVERTGQPFEPPCALFCSGEMIVTVGQERGMGGRNQEYAVSAALQIAGSPNIVIASVDSDGTDGPGHQFAAKGSETIPVLDGGIVDGETVAQAKALGVDLVEALKAHNTSPALHKLGCGVAATQNISLNDLTIALVMGKS